MKRRMLCLILAGWLAEARAQGPPVTAEGTAFGSRASLGGQPIDDLTTADTDEVCPTTHSATAPGSFVCLAPPEGSVSLPGVITVVNSGPSNTFGVAEADVPCDSTVTSTAGQDPAGDCPSAGEDKNSVVVALPGPPPLAEAANTCSKAMVSGTTGAAAISFVESAAINGSPVPINSSADTTIIDGEVTIRLNHAVTIADASTGTLSIRVDAVRIEVPGDASLLQVLLSSSQATLTNLPATCPAFHCPGFDLTMRSAFERDEGCESSPDAGDQLRFTLEVTNSGRGGGANLLLVDRIPENATLDPASPMLDGEPAAFDTDCPETVAFTACPRSSASTPQCVAVQAGDLPVGATKILTFTVTVNSTGDVCNTAVASVTPADPLCNASRVDREVSSLVLAEPSCPPTTPTETPTSGTPTPTESGGRRDRLRTTGSGGCALGSAEAGGDAWPVLVIALLLLAHRRGRRSRRSGRS